MIRVNVLRKNIFNIGKSGGGWDIGLGKVSFFLNFKVFILKEIFFLVLKIFFFSIFIFVISLKYW